MSFHSLAMNVLPLSVGFLCAPGVIFFESPAGLLRSDHPSSFFFRIFSTSGGQLVSGLLCQQPPRMNYEAPCVPKNRNRVHIQAKLHLKLCCMNNERCSLSVRRGTSKCLPILAWNLNDPDDLLLLSLLVNFG